jgi:hypothetical protein
MEDLMTHFSVTIRRKSGDTYYSAIRMTAAEADAMAREMYDEPVGVSVMAMRPA